MAPPEDQPAAPSVVTLERGQYYDTTGPQGEPCVIMTRDTWVDYGTLVEKQRSTMQDMDKRIKELVEEYKSLLEQHNNLRDVRRAEKRPDIEGGLILPGSERFKQGKKK